MKNFKSIFYFFRKGILYGLLATLVMTIFMFASVQTNLSPINDFIPVVIAKLLIGKASENVIMISALIMHLIYGSINGGIVAVIFRSRSTFQHGLLWGFLLWLIMQLVVFPTLDWGLFGTDLNFKIALSTLILHLTYGFVLGIGLNGLKKKYLYMSNS